METAIFARHGESTASAAGIVNGDPSVDVRLTEAGRVEARALGRDLAGTPVDLCVTTEFERTAETADLALEDRRPPVPRLVVAELNDITLGNFEGETIEEYRAWLQANGPMARIPGGGESRAEVVARYARGLKRLVERPEPVILAVVHALTVAYAQAGAARAPLPLTLAEHHVSYATPYRLSNEQLSRAVLHLEDFGNDPATAPRTSRT
jgi:2,3-bisphosphoglycerate-dependent phosphoglycerate mutase